MKKVLAVILTMIISVVIASCGDKAVTTEMETVENVVEFEIESDESLENKVDSEEIKIEDQETNEKEIEKEMTEISTEKANCEKMNSYEISGLSFDISDKWEVDEKFYADSYDYASGCRFVSGNINKNNKNILYVGYEKIAAVMFVGKDFNRDTFADVYSYSRVYQRLNSQWKVLNNIEVYCEELIDDGRKGVCFLIPQGKENYYVITLFCSDEELLQNTIENMTANWSLEQQQVLMFEEKYYSNTNLLSFDYVNDVNSFYETPLDFEEKTYVQVYYFNEDAVLKYVDELENNGWYSHGANVDEEKFSVWMIMTKNNDMVYIDSRPYDNRVFVQYPIKKLSLEEFEEIISKDLLKFLL